MTRRIFITGCARCGTTLLKRLFYSFLDVQIIPKEISLESFVSYKAKKPILVGKRTCKTVFSNILSQEVIDNQLKIIKQNGILVINCVRDKDDMAKESWPVLERYQASVEQSKQYSQYLALTILFELLVNKPDVIQDKIQNVLGLIAQHQFSDYPVFVPSIEFKTKDPRYSQRRIGEYWR